MLKMLDLYLSDTDLQAMLPEGFPFHQFSFGTFKIGHTSCNMLCILNKLRLQFFVTNNVFWTKKVKTQKKRINYCRRREFDPGALAPKADALPLHHGVYCKYWENLI